MVDVWGQGDCPALLNLKPEAGSLYKDIFLSWYWGQFPPCQSWRERRKQDWPHCALLYVRILNPGWAICPESLQMIFADVRPLLVRLVDRSLGADSSERVEGTDLPGEGVHRVHLFDGPDGAASSKLYIDKAGGGGVPVAGAWPVTGKWSCYEMFPTSQVWQMSVLACVSQL